MLDLVFRIELACLGPPELLLHCFPQKTSLRPLRNFTRYCGNTDNFKDDILRHILRCEMLLATNGTLTCKLTEND